MNCLISINSCLKSAYLVLRTATTVEGFSWVQNLTAILPGRPESYPLSLRIATTMEGFSLSFSTNPHSNPNNKIKDHNNTLMKMGVDIFPKWKLLKTNEPKIRTGHTDIGYTERFTQVCDLSSSFHFINNPVWLTYAFKARDIRRRACTGDKVRIRTLLLCHKDNKEKQQVVCNLNLHCPLKELGRGPVRKQLDVISSHLQRKNLPYI